MFTGIIETIGVVRSIETQATNKAIWVSATFTGELKIDQSVAHNGVCLTVAAISGHQYQVVAIDETLKRTNLASLCVGDRINLERCMIANGRFDGHVVQGHVDTTATVTAIEDRQGSWSYRFSLGQPHGGLIVEKGSICINGVSLTVVDVDPFTFSVAIIPYTYEHTTFSDLKMGSVVNIEFDIVGKYVRAMLNK